MTKSSRQPLIDTDVIIRLLTGDARQKQERARALFKQIEAGELTVLAPVTVIADALYVLTSPAICHLAKNEAVGLLLAIVRLPHFRVTNRRTVLRAMDLYVSANIDFGDAYIAATLERLGADTVYSYDKGFDRIKGIKRLEP